MSESNKEYVQCFYNVNYNYGSSEGVSKYAWGFGVFHLLGNSAPLLEQVQNSIESSRGVSTDDMFNVNITSFTPFPDEVFRTK